MPSKLEIRAADVLALVDDLLEHGAQFRTESGQRTAYRLRHEQERCTHKAADFLLVDQLGRPDLVALLEPDEAA